MGLFGNNNSFIGLDVGSTAIRLVELRPHGNRPALAGFASVPMPPGLAASDSEADRVRISGMIRQMLKDNRITTKNVVSGLPSGKIFATVITTPKLDGAQLAKAIRYQAEQYIPMAIDQVKVDHAVVDTSADGQNIDVLLIAAPTTVVERSVTMLEEAGLEPMALEANGLAVARSLVPPINIAVVILDISTLDSDIAIIANNTPRLLRSVSIGAGTLVKAVAANLGLDEAQATQFTYKFGLTQSKLEGQVLKAIKPSIDGLISEIDKSIKYFNGRYPGIKLEKLVITGQAISLPELAPYIATTTGLPVEFGNAWSSVSYASSLQDQLMGLSSEFAAAVGLAERGML